MTPDQFGELQASVATLIADATRLEKLLARHAPTTRGGDTPRKIPVELEETIVARVRGGESLAATAAWLATEHGVNVTRQAVHAVIARHTA